MRAGRRRLPDFSFEKLYWEKGYSFVIGVDEVGRGALAGPVVAGAACAKATAAKAASLRSMINDLRFKNIHKSLFIHVKSISKVGIDDSKRLTPQKRTKFSTIIPKYFHIGIGEASVEEINNVGIVRATEKAMRRAIRDLRIKIYELRIHNSLFINHKSMYFLVDGNRTIGGIKKSQQSAIVSGDQKSVSIAAASIMVKVHRDRLMRDLAGACAHYGWDHNAGYGTVFHRDAIARYGATGLHRTLFVDRYIST